MSECVRTLLPLATRALLTPQSASENDRVFCEELTALCVSVCAPQNTCVRVNDAWLRASLSLLSLSDTLSLHTRATALAHTLTHTVVGALLAQRTLITPSAQSESVYNIVWTRIAHSLSESLLSHHTQPQSHTMPSHDTITRAEITDALARAQFMSMCMRALRRCRCANALCGETQGGICVCGSVVVSESTNTALSLYVRALSRVHTQTSPHNALMEDCERALCERDALSLCASQVHLQRPLSPATMRVWLSLCMRAATQHANIVVFREEFGSHAHLCSCVHAMWRESNGKGE